MSGGVRLLRCMRRPLLTPGEKGASDFMLVRRHATWLREWFMRHCQWTLHVESELARFAQDAWRPQRFHAAAAATKEQSFTRRRYVVLCWAGSAGESERKRCCDGWRMPSPASLLPSAVGPQQSFL